MSLRSSGVRASVVPGAGIRWLTTTARGLAQECQDGLAVLPPWWGARDASGGASSHLNRIARRIWS
jgi:hypothetical protein